MKRVLVAALALSTLLGSVAMADSHDRNRGHQERHDSNRRDNHRSDNRHNDRRDYRGNRHDDRRDWNDRRRDDRHWDGRHRDDRRSFHRPDHGGYNHQRYRVSRYYRPHGYRHHVWYSGARLPSAYYAPRYVVHDYGSYRLRHPPHGYHWVRVDNDVLLAAIATGVVVQVVNGLFYY